MKDEIPHFLLKQEDLSGAQRPAGRHAFIDKGISRLSDLVKTTYVQWDLANREGFLQRLDARIKLVFMLSFIIIISMKREVFPEVLVMVFIFMLVAASRINLLYFYKRVIFFGIIFGFLVALPSSLNVITRGEVIIPLLSLAGPHDFWIYHVPASIGITREGLSVVEMLTLRVVNSLSLSLLIINTTPFTDMMKALKSFRAPSSFLLIMTLSYKYIFIFANILEEMHLSRKSRTVDADSSRARVWIAGRVAFMFRKTQARCDEVFKAMSGRGLCGDIAFYHDRGINKHDLAAGFFLFSAGVLLLLA